MAEYQRSNLDRAQQVFWDGFHGTAQPTFAESGMLKTRSAVPPVRWILDEAGWQTDTRRLAGYAGHENTPTITEATQARYYSSVIRRYACDPRVAAFLFFHWIDERDRDRLQTDLVRANNTIKPAAKAVENAISTGCVSQHSRWRHSTGVNGAAQGRRRTPRRRPHGPLSRSPSAPLRRARSQLSVEPVRTGLPAATRLSS